MGQENKNRACRDNDVTSGRVASTYAVQVGVVSNGAWRESLRKIRVWWRFGESLHP